MQLGSWTLVGRLPNSALGSNRLCGCGREGEDGGSSSMEPVVLLRPGTKVDAKWMRITESVVGKEGRRSNCWTHLQAVGYLGVGSFWRQ